MAGYNCELPCRVVNGQGTPGHFLETQFERNTRESNMKLLEKIESAERPEAPGVRKTTLKKRKRPKRWGLSARAWNRQQKLKRRRAARAEKPEKVRNKRTVYTLGDCVKWVRRWEKKRLELGLTDQTPVKEVNKAKRNLLEKVRLNVEGLNLMLSKVRDFFPDHFADSDAEREDAKHPDTQSFTHTF